VPRGNAGRSIRSLGKPRHKSSGRANGRPRTNSGTSLGDLDALGVVAGVQFGGHDYGRRFTLRSTNQHPISDGQPGGSLAVTRNRAFGRSLAIRWRRHCEVRTTGEGG
jgi:hypothetical protein